MIYFAGQPLLLGDIGYHFATWLERSLSLADLRLFGSQPVALQDGRWLPRASHKARVGLPVANWSFPPRMKVNTLWWPTGASRWATGLFLCDKAALKEIVAAVDSGGGSVLKLGEDETGGRSLEITMYMLPPRPLSTPATAKKEVLDEANGERLFLLPLVDQRYFWQFKSTGQQWMKNWSWEGALSDLAALVGASIEIDDIASVYEDSPPDLFELSRAYEDAPPALLLDAVAWCVGHRIVLGTDNVLYSMNAAGSAEIIGKNLAGWPSTSTTDRGDALPATIWAGGFSSSSRTGSDDDDVLTYYEQPRWPEKIRVVFPRWSYGWAWDDPHLDVNLDWDVSNVYAIDVNGSDVIEGYTEETSKMVEGRVKVFHDTAMAKFDTEFPTDIHGALLVDDLEPDNLTDLTALAEQIATDYYAWLAVETYDLSMLGIKHWCPCGHDDAIWWHWGYQPERDSLDPDSNRNFTPEAGDYYAAFTRVSSLPADWGYSQLLHQFHPVPAPVDHFELYEDLDVDSTTGAEAYRRDWEPSNNEGHGEWWTNTGADKVIVKDTRKMGYYGSAGAKGACEVKIANKGPFGEINDLECP